MYLKVLTKDLKSVNFDFYYHLGLNTDPNEFNSDKKAFGGCGLYFTNGEEIAYFIPEDAEEYVIAEVGLPENEEVTGYPMYGLFRAKSIIIKSVHPIDSIETIKWLNDNGCRMDRIIPRLFKVGTVNEALKEVIKNNTIPSFTIGMYLLSSVSTPYNEELFNYIMDNYEFDNEKDLTRAMKLALSRPCNMVAAIKIASKCTDKQKCFNTITDYALTVNTYQSAYSDYLKANREYAKCYKDDLLECSIACNKYIICKILLGMGFEVNESNLKLAYGIKDADRKIFKLLKKNYKKGDK